MSNIPVARWQRGQCGTQDARLAREADEGAGASVAWERVGFDGDVFDVCFVNEEAVVAFAVGIDDEGFEFQTWMCHFYVTIIS